MNKETSSMTSGAGMAPELQVQKAAVPVWILVFLLLLIYWGMLYFDLHGGWFNKDVYGPYRSVAQLEVFQPPKGGDDEIVAKGKQLFSVTCAVCHMENGTGNPGNGCPPLVGSEWVSAPGTTRLIMIVSRGLSGPIEVKGQSYGTGTMLPIGNQMEGDEKQKSQNIAAIISYVRKTFGNGASAVKPDKVEQVRAPIKDSMTAFTVEDLNKVPPEE